MDYNTLYIIIITTIIITLAEDNILSCLAHGKGSDQESAFPDSA
jgi:hypothetical protein